MQGHCLRKGEAAGTGAVPFLADLRTNPEIEENLEGPMTQNSDSQKRKLKYAGRAILITMIIVPFIPFMLAIGVSFHYFTTALENNTRASLERIVSDHGDMVGHLSDGAKIRSIVDCRHDQF